MAIVFDTSTKSSNVTSQANTLPISWSHTVGAGSDRAAVVAVVNGNGGSNGGFTPTGTPTCTVGGVSMTWLGHVTMDAVNKGFIAVWAGLGPPTGSQTVATSIACAGQTNNTAYGVAFTYTGVGSISAITTAQGTSSSPSVSVASAAGKTVWGALGNWWNDTFSSFTLTARQTNTAGMPYFISGDGAGASPKVVSATQSNSREWAAVGLALTEAIPVDTKQFFAMF